MSSVGDGNVHCIRVYRRGYKAADIDKIIEQYYEDKRSADELYDEMTKALEQLARVCSQSTCIRHLHQRVSLHSVGQLSMH